MVTYMKKLKKALIVFLVLGLFCSLGYTFLGMTNHKINTVAKGNETTANQKPNIATTNYKLLKSIKLDKLSLSITKGKKAIIKASLKYQQDSSSPKEPVVWVSKNTSIASVNSKGKITALKAGTTYIVCKGETDKIKARCKIEVRDPYNKIKTLKLTSTSLRVGKNQKRFLDLKTTYDKNKKYKNEPVVWISTNNKVVTVKNGVIKGKKTGTAYIKARSKYTNETAKCKVTVVKKLKYVAFTFDDGPGEYTDKLLSALKKHESKATFFVLGNRANSFKKQLQREYNLGMEIGSHTWSHKNLKILSEKNVKKEISYARNAIKNVTGEYPTLLRPPYGNYNSIVSKNAKAPMIYWSVDTEDWKYRNVKYIKNYVINHACDGQIILLHDIHPTSVNGFIKALPELRKKGYELVTVSELYKIKGKTMKNGIMYFGPNY
jgi:peptidoglycan/xylan/chitin deacetylase (PgdA/CDA1 family)